MSHNFQQRRQERMRGTGTSSVTQSSQKFQFKLPAPAGSVTASGSVATPASKSNDRRSSSVSSTGRPVREASTRPPRDPYVFSGSTNNASAPTAGASGSRGATPRSTSGSTAKRTQSTTSQPPRSALKGGRASASGRVSVGRNRTLPDDEDELDEVPADDFDDGDFVERDITQPDADASMSRSVSFKQPPSSKSTGRASTAKTLSKGKGRQTTLSQFTGGAAAASPASAAANRNEARRQETRQRSPSRAAPPRDKEKERKRREAEKQRERERKEAKKAAAAINKRSKKRKRSMAGGGEDDEDVDEDEEFQVEFEDDEDGEEAGPDVTLQEEVMIGARVVKDARRMNGQTAKLMRKRLRRAIRLALEDDDDALGDPDATNADADGARKRRRLTGGGAEKLTDADVIWSVLDAELKAASNAQASSIASSTLRELRKIVRTLFEGLSIKASERRELITQLERARNRKKRIRKDVFETRREVLKNEEEIEKIKKDSLSKVHQAKTAQEGLSFFEKLKDVCRLWT